MAGAAAAPAARRRPFAWVKVLRPALYWLGLAPAAWTFWLALHDQLGADPAKALQNTLGLWALRFLLVGLAVTPLRRLTGLSLLPYRRALGLLTFAYALFHLTAWVVLTMGLDGPAILKEVWKRPYITIGMLAFAILLPLAATSSQGAIRRLGGAVWSRLHKWVYLAAAAAAVHFLLVVKAWPPEPLVYLAITAVLLGWRLVAWVRRPARQGETARAVPAAPVPG